MSHEEIWDDSALVESWDEAVAEYKRYHSIHARGEKVEDVLREYEEGSNTHATRDFAAHGEDEAVLEDDMIVDEQQEPVAANGTSIAQLEGRTVEGAGESINGKPPAAAEAAPSLAPPLPSHLVGSVQDEGLKNLLMSWYYAGYYTGLYEGAKKCQQIANAADNAKTE